MKKVIGVCCIAASVLPVAAHAQSSVTISGIADIGVRYDSGATGGGIWSVSSGQMYGSRMNFIGVEDLGDGLKTSFVLEMGIALDSGAGTATPPGADNALAFGRTSAISIGKDSTGYLSLGRQYTPLWALSASGSSDPFVGSWLGGNSVVYSNTVLVSNSVVYSYGYGERTMLGATPRYGLGFAAMYGFGEAVPPGQPANAGRQMGFSASYGVGNWFAGYGRHQVDGSSAAISLTAPVSDKPRLVQQTLAGAYDFGFLRLHAGLNTAKNDGAAAVAVDRRSWSMGTTIPVSTNQSVRLMIGKAHNNLAGSSDWKMFQAGYYYELSKRTALYAAYGMINNDANAATAFGRSLGTFARGSAPKAFITGIRHNF